MAIRIQLRRGTTAQWDAADPTLAAAEVGVAVDGGAVQSVRVGNGVDPWSDLPELGGRTHWSNEPPTPADGDVGDLWVVTSE